MRFFQLFHVCILLFVISCVESADNERTTSSSSRPVKIVFFGDHWTAGTNPNTRQHFPGMIQALADSSGFHWKVVNASVSRETLGNALERVDWLLQQSIDFLIIAHDIDGQKPDQQNLAVLSGLVERIKKRAPSCVVLLVSPTFKSLPIYQAIADRYELPLYSGLASVTNEQAMLEPSGDHLNEAGVVALVRGGLFEWLTQLTPSVPSPHTD